MESQNTYANSVRWRWRLFNAELTIVADGVSIRDGNVVVSGYGTTRTLRPGDPSDARCQAGSTAHLLPANNTTHSTCW